MGVVRIFSKGEQPCFQAGKPENVPIKLTFHLFQFTLTDHLFRIEEYIFLSTYF
jgi:hypothetical protein